MNKHTIIDMSTGEKKCSCFKRCGGCQLDKTYAQQIEWKQAKADRMLSRFCRPQQIITMDDPYNYRNKVQTVYKVNSSKRIVSGVYQSSTHSMVITDDCFLEDIRAQQIVATLKELMADFRILPYNEESDQGLLKHTLIRTSQTTGEVMLVLVTATPIFPAKKNFVKAITEKHPYITTIVQNVNKGRVPLTLGDRDIIMYGKGYITDEMCGCKFRISPHSFYQVNPQQTKVLYSKALEYAELKGQELVWDLYCGIGTISLFLAQKAKQVYGVEIIKEAIDDARRNAALNHMDNVEFFVGKAEEVVPAQYEKTGIHPDVIVVDPPRKGCDAILLNTMLDMAPKRIVYVSCDPATLARDLKILCEEKYTLEKVSVVDQFSHSVHVESVCALKRVDE